MTCDVCGERLALTAVDDHFRVMHPDEYGDGFLTWPDGEVVVFDCTDYTADEIAGKRGRSR